MSIQDRVSFLRNEINKHNYNYYVMDNPTISDFEYDELFKELKDIEEAHPELVSEDSPTHRVGSISEKFEEYKHEYRYHANSCK